MIKSFLKNLFYSGIRDSNHLTSGERYILLTNYISVTFSLAFWILLLIPQNRNVGALFETLLFFVFFLLPVFLNRFGWVTLSKFCICWMPLAVISWAFRDALFTTNAVDASRWDGLKIYLIGFGSVPYLVFDFRRTTLIILAALPSLLLISFLGPIVQLIGLLTGYPAGSASNYDFNTFRSLIAYIMVVGSCVSLKAIIAKSDMVNQGLLKDLELKNHLLKLQSEGELKQVIDQLNVNLEALESRELMLKKSQRVAKVGSWEFIKATQKFNWSEEMYEILEVAGDQYITTAFFSEILLNGEKDRDRSFLVPLIEAGNSYDFVLPVLTPSGLKKWLRVSGFPIETHGAIVGSGGVIQDISQFKESDVLIKTNEKKYRSLFEQASDAIVITDLNGEFLDVNQSMCELVGYSKEELLRLNTSNIIDPINLQEAPVRYDLLRQGFQVFHERKMVHKDGHIVFTETNVKMFGSDQIVAIVRDITARKKIEEEKEKAQHALKERIKELTTLYKASQIISSDGRSIFDVLQDVANVLPAGWQHQDICTARIVAYGVEFVSPHFSESNFVQRVSFHLPNEQVGKIEVFYLEETADEAEGPFLLEERSLLNAIGEMLQIFLTRKYEQEILDRYQANLRSTINNTEFRVWSVDRTFKLQTYNEPYAKYMKERYNVEVRIGFDLVGRGFPPGNEELLARWRSYYLRALTGEAVRIEEVRFGRDQIYSLNPIIEKDHIIGISVFAEDVTEKKQQDRELAEANKKLGDLRVMALRSVMNQHFIFNVLNSIQYFIIKNDRLNAINYLAMFSKLIRNVLNHSVRDQIKLRDELDMLKDYVELEKVRFENKFDCIFEIDDELDVDQIEIPSLVVQPYVENAILHGLYNLSGRGNLIVRAKQDDNHVIFEIQDNGIGRDAAQKLKVSNPLHKSIGTKLTEERLQLINADKGVAVQYEDLANGNAPAGTLVKIKMKTF